MNQTDLTSRYSAVMMNAFGAPKRVFERGEGVHLYDADGNRYLDLLSGLAVNALGHNHAGVTAAVAAQLGRLGHVSNFFASEGQIRLAERLAAVTGAERSRVFFTNSGTEANEAAFKLTRLTGRTRIVAMEGSFHGRTMGALAITHNPKYREPFEPLPGDVEFVPFGDVDALRGAVDDRTAAVVVETIQGENGVVPAPDGFLAAARDITRSAGALLWIDEVQTGLGRCGEYLAHRADGVVADLVTLAKGLGNGFPVGACLASGPALDLLQPGQHGTTFGGNPVAAAAGNAVLDALEDGVLDNARATGAWLAAAVRDLGHPVITGVRGRGMLLGVTLDREVAPAVADAALDAGFVVNAPRPAVLRLAPPLIAVPADLAPFVEALPGLLSAHV
ncbi:acetylornithine aminotransferase [Tessaracoccus lapidicaptus]|uniref:Acetylornithine aminotransferase n=1 Tax=Tessaracoccus lapidicaptus TaxID=1427523 RepID=A0A1C0AGN5_9ACTN|nr:MULTISPECIES: acetylornithine transaminase [Tessaracoccus]AQX14921.1 aspartate aminotransferase family protein [Tessaracoccus sp. T2.5-30]OCL30827.1 acetylornithine aminotransferase [Tessaracoccus lapidicaptus]VEP39081.1 Acetylornithine aminotransferase [Tessaracoccus lapidicaptus]